MTRRAVTAATLLVVAGLVAGFAVWLDEPEKRNALPANAASGPAPSGRCAPDAKLTPPCGAWWGAYVPYAKNGSLTDAVYDFEGKIGRRLDLVYTYHDMSDTPLDGELLTPEEQALGRDRLLMLAWESTVWTRAAPREGTRKTSWGGRRSRPGAYDESIIDPQARRIKAYGKRVFFSFDQEVDAAPRTRGRPRSTSPPTAMSTTASSDSVWTTWCGCGRSPAISPTATL